MNNLKYKCLVENAKVLCDMTQKMQNTLLELFFEEFLEIEEEEKRMNLSYLEPPF